MRTRFERFCFRHRDKGIPNLMLYIVIGCGMVSILSLIGYSQIYQLLAFDRNLILKGQVWRLFTWTLAEGSGAGLFLSLIFLYCYYSLGRAVEAAWGTFRFNLFYLGGVILMDVFAMTLGGIPVVVDGVTLLQDGYYLYAGSMSAFLHLSLVISFATLYPDSRFTLFFFIPIKAWVLALIYLIIVAVQVLQLTFPDMIFPHNLFPLVAMANYFLFFGKDVLNLLPLSWRARRKGPKKNYAPAEPIPFDRNNPKEKAKAPYMHRCAVCGRTDVSDPQLEFRYCSRCNGYFCYCEDHISNHTHVE